MATDGLSLVGFITDQQTALNHLRFDCVPPDPSDAALIPFWNAAQAAIGAPFNQIPAVPLPMPATTQPYMQALLAQPWLADRLIELNQMQTEMGMPPVSFQHIYIDALLAHQMVVDVDRSNHHCGALNSPPTEAQLLNLCLPIGQPHEDYFAPPVFPNSTSTIIKLRNHNLMMHRWGIFDETLASNGEITAPWPVPLSLAVTTPSSRTVVPDTLPDGCEHVGPRDCARGLGVEPLMVAMRA